MDVLCQAHRTCHCGAHMGNSDHCPCCLCEEFEGTCTLRCPNVQALDHFDHH
jgi:hypothetical protein